MIMKTTKNRKAARVHLSHQDATVESFRRDPKFAAAYLNAVLEDGDRAELMTALRYVTQAFGGVSAVAHQTGLNTTSLYRTLSPRGNPELKSFMDIMKSIGMRLLVEPTPALKGLGFADYKGKIIAIEDLDPLRKRPARTRAGDARRGRRAA